MTCSSPLAYDLDLMFMQSLLQLLLLRLQQEEEKPEIFLGVETTLGMKKFLKEL